MGLRNLPSRPLANRRARRRAQAFFRSKSRQRRHIADRPSIGGTIQLESLEPRVLLSASVFTDKPDYAPGETAIISGQGYQPGETVELQVLHIEAGPDEEFGTADDTLGDNTGSGHDPWFVTDGAAGDLDGAEDGNILTEWYVDPDDSLNETFRLTAVGQTSGQVATTMFTDGQLDLWAWRNQPGPTLDSWDAGTTIQQANSVYAEDEVIPYRWTSTSGGGSAPNLQEGVTYTVRIDYAFAGGTTDPGKFFHDYLTSYDATEAASAPFGAGSDLAGFQSGNLTTTAIPNDPSVSVQQPGVLTLFNIDAGSVTFGSYTADPVNANQTDRTIDITFTPDDGDGTPNEFLNVGIAWGGHLASQTDYGFENGAANFPGASPQMVVDLDPSTAGEVSNVNINPNAIVAQGQITIIKDADPDSDQDFSFNSNITGFESFQLDDDTDGTLDNQITFFGLNEGTYTFTETATSGWVLTSITPVENGAEDTTVDDIFVITGNSIEISLANGEAWEVTFLNEPAPAPSIDLTKTVTDVDGGGAGAAVDAAGDVISYQIDILNDGNVALNETEVLDNVEGHGDVDLTGTFSGDDGDGVLQVGETWTYTTSYTVTQADIDTQAAGDVDIDNIASATFTDDNGNTASDSDVAAVPISLLPSIDLTKTVTDVDGGGAGAAVDAAGDVISYQIDILNDGNVALNETEVLDNVEGHGDVDLTGTFSGDDGDGVLQVGETWTYTTSYTVTQADIDTQAAGDVDIDNIASATFTDDNGNTASDSDVAAVPISLLPSIDLTKTVTDVDGGGAGAAVDAAGDVISYQIDILNDGNVALNETEVLDNVEGHGDVDLTGTFSGDDGDGVLQVGETWTYTTSYTVTQDDIDTQAAGDVDIDNIASATFTDDQGNTASDSDVAVVPISLLPSIDLTKTVTDVDGGGAGAAVDAAGDVISYQIDILNDGNVALNETEVLDNVEGHGDVDLTGTFSGDDGDGVLQVGETWTYTTSYTVTQDDIDTQAAGDVDIDNIASATFTDDNGNTASDSDVAAVPISLLPSIDLTKTVTDVDGGGAGAAVDAAGDVISYQIDILNDGNVALNETEVLDNVEGHGDVDLTGTFSGDDGDGVLQVGETWTYTTSYTVTQDDIDTQAAGDVDIDNIASATFTDDQGNTASDSDVAAVPISLLPSIDLTKTVTDVDGGGAGAAVDAAGDVISYQIDILNDGNVALNETEVLDNVEGHGDVDLTGTFSGDDGDGVLQVGETWTYTTSYTVTQDDIDTQAAGDVDIDNIASATFTDDQGNTASDSDVAAVPISLLPSIDLTKTVTDVDGGGAGAAVDAAGDVISYQIDILNDGNVALNETEVLDNVEGHGDVDLTGTFSGDDGDGVLQVGETWTYTTSYTVTQDDIDTQAAGDVDIDNIASATFTDDQGNTASDSDVAVVPISLLPSIDLTKTVTDVDGGGAGAAVDAAGDVISYQIDILNDGNVALNETEVLDNVEGHGDVDLTGAFSGDDGDGVLQVGETWTYTTSYTVTQDDIDTQAAGDVDIDNIASATFTDDQGNTASDSDVAAVPISLLPSIDLTKTVTDVDGGGAGAAVDAAGDVISYQIDILNDGNVALNETEVLDNVEGHGDVDLTGTFSGDDGDGVLQVGETWTYTTSYTVTQADIDTQAAGDVDIDNIASATFTDDNGNTASDSDVAVVPISLLPSIDLTKTVTDVDGGGAGAAVDAAGDVISYQIDILNDGNVALNETEVLDNVEGHGDVDLTGTFSGDDGDGVLQVGETWTYTTSYTVTQDDIDTQAAGDVDIDNIASATFTDDQGNTASDSDVAAVPISLLPSIDLTKTVTDVDGGGAAASVDAAGDVISYQIDILNDGNVALNETEVLDNVEGHGDVDLTGTFSGDDGDGVLQVGETWTYTTSYTVTQDDIDTQAAGDVDIDNIASATFTDDQGNTASDSDVAAVPISLLPSIDLTKTVTDVDGGGAAASVDAAGDVISYQIDILNDGNVALNETEVLDNVEGHGDVDLTGTFSGDDGDGVLQVGETWTYTTSYTVTQDDIDTQAAGDVDIDNIASATFTDDQGNTASDSDVAAVPISLLPSIDLTKTVTDVDGGGAGASVDAAGDVISYQIDILNDGNVALNETEVLDNVEGHGDVDLTGTFSGDDGDGILQVGETWTYTTSYTVTQADIDTQAAGDVDIDNIASATFTDDQGNTASDSDVAAVPISLLPSIDLTKTVTDVDGGGAGAAVDAAGDVISYQIDILNDGNVALNETEVLDNVEGHGDVDLTGTFSGDDGDGVLQVGETWTYTTSYTVTQDDIDTQAAGDVDIDNIASATFTDDQGNTASDSDVAVVPISLLPSIDLTKTVTDVDGGGAGAAVDAAGDVISYQIDILNDGNVALNETEVLDNVEAHGDVDLTGTFSGDDGDGVLQVGETWTYTTSYTVTQADIDTQAAGDVDIDNIASATFTDDQGNTASDSDVAAVPISLLPSIDLTKTVTDVDGGGAGAAVDAAGDVISYQIDILNDGNVALNETEVLDNVEAHGDVDLTGTFSGDDGDGVLQVGETWTYTTSYTVTQADIDTQAAGDVDIDNIASATFTDDNGNTASDSDVAVVPISLLPSIDLTKTVTDVDGGGAAASVDAAGDVISYQIDILNDGNVALNETEVLDNVEAHGDVDLTGAFSGDDGDGVLQVGETWTYTTSYTVTQDDIDTQAAGDVDIDNIASATFTDDQGNTASDSDVAVVPISLLPSIDLTKTVTDVDGGGAAASVDAAGDVISYQIDILNDGNVALNETEVLDNVEAHGDVDLTGTFSGDDGDGVLQVGETWTYTTSYTVTQADIDTQAAGDVDIDNIASATFTDDNGNTASDSDVAAVPISLLPSIDLTKTVTDVDGGGAAASVDAAGDVISYQIDILNDGNVALNETEVLDNVEAHGDVDLTGTFSGDDGDGVLQVGETWTYTTSYTVTQADIDTQAAGDVDIDNIASATFTDDQGNTASDSDVAAVPISLLPSIDLTKTVTDVDGGGAAASVDAAGDVISYQIDILNDGNVALNETEVLDNVEAHGDVDLTGTFSGDDGDGVLQVGETWTYTTSYTVTQADIDTQAAGDVDIDNIASATFTDDQGNTASDSDVAAVPISLLPSIDLTKTVTDVDGGGAAASVDAAGDVISYQIDILNDGNVALNETEVLDNVEAHGDVDLTGTFSGDDGDGVLQVGETWTYTTSYTVTQADIDTQAAGDVDIDNIASATFTDDQGNTASDSDVAAVPISLLPSIDLTKTVTDVDGGGAGAAVDAAGDVISYQIDILNDGNVALNETEVLDNVEAHGDVDLTGTFSGDDGDGVLQVGETWTYTTSYTVTQDDIDTQAAGDVDIDNIASATFTDDQGNTASDSDVAAVPISLLPSIDLTKTVTDVDGGGAAASVDAAGDVISYQIDILNDGNVALNETEVLDNVEAHGDVDLTGTFSGDDGDGVLQVGETWTYTTSYTVTQDDIDTQAAGDVDIDNIASATFTDDNGNTASDSDVAVVPISLLPSIDLTKTVTDVDGGGAAASVDAAGDVISYQIDILNDGNVALNETEVLDNVEAHGDVDLTGAFSGDDGDGVLQVGETWTYTTSYTVTQADIDTQAAGDVDIDNIASATFTDDQGNTASDSDVAAVPISLLPSIDLTKTVTDVDGGGAGAAVDAAGDVISYQIDILNDGNVALNETEVLDNVEAHGDVDLTGTFSGDDGDGVLQVGETWTYTTSYTVTQDDIDTQAAGDVDIDNIASATFTDDQGNTASDSDVAAVPISLLPSIDLTKTVTDVDGGGAAASVDAAGDVISYQIDILNDGNVALNETEVLDNVEAHGDVDLTGTFSGDDGDGVLQVGETWTYTTSYTVTQDDIDTQAAGDVDIDNIASATFTDDNGNTASDSDVAVVPISLLPSIDLTKTVTDVDGGGAAASVDAAGDVISYQIDILNDGNVALNETEVLDNVEGHGDVDLTGTFSGDDGDGVLQVGETWTYTTSYTVTQDDIDTQAAGDVDIDNIASATFTDDQGNTASDSDVAAVPISLLPSIDLTKTVTDVDDGGAAASVDAAGDVISYQIDILNDGNVALNETEVLDNVEAHGDVDLTGAFSGDDGDGVLQVGETWTYTTSYTVTQDDIDTQAAGDVDIDNIASATFTDDQGNTASDSDVAAVPISLLPSIDLTKTVTDVDGGGAAASVDAAGDVISYQIDILNDGNVALNETEVLDNVEAHGDVDLTGAFSGDDGDGVLQVGETWTYTTSYTVTQADIDTQAAGDVDIDNIASATFTDDQGNTASDSDVAAVPISLLPSIDLIKTFAHDSVIAGGLGSSFTLVITNTGNVTLSDALIEDTVDARLEVTNVFATAGADADTDGNAQTIEWLVSLLAPNQTETITVNFTVDSSVPEANGTGGVNDDPNVLNTATVAAEKPGGNEDPADDITDTDSDTIDILTEIDLSIVKNFYRIDDNDTPNNPNDDFLVDVADDLIEQGTTGFFTLTVANNGPSDAFDVNVTDTVSPSLEVLAVFNDLNGNGVQDVGETDDFDGDGLGDCDPLSQDITCMLDIAVGNSVTFTVQYEAAPFLDPEAPSEFNTQEGDDFQFFFLNGYKIKGSSDTNGAATLIVTAPDGFEQILPYDGTRNELNFDPSLILDEDETQVFPNDDPFTIHLSCSDPFAGGWGSGGGTNGPIEGVDTNWQISSYSILRFNQNGFFRACGDVVVPMDVPNTAIADGADSNSSLGSDELVSDTDSVQVIRQLKIEKRSDLVTKGKKADVLLFNSGNESLTISEIDVTWPGGNGDLVEVTFGSNTIYATPESTSPAIIDGDDGDGSPWVGTETDRTIDPGEGLKLGFFFKNKTKSGTDANPYQIKVTLEGLITTEVVQVFDPTPPAPLHVDVDNASDTDFGGGDELTHAALRPVITQAVAYWADQGIDHDQLQDLRKAQVQITDLPDTLLGMANETTNTILLDTDAAGYGWSITPSPQMPVDSDDVDLLSVVVHEFGHLLGLSHDVLDDTLLVGVRDLPSLESQNEDADDDHAPSPATPSSDLNTLRREERHRRRMTLSPLTDQGVSSSYGPVQKSGRPFSMTQNQIKNRMFAKNVKWTLTEL